MLRIEPHQHVTQHRRAEGIFDWNEETLVQVVAQLFKTEHVGFDLLRRNLLVYMESAPARRTDRHRRKAVIVAGNAGCFRNECRIRLLQ